MKLGYYDHGIRELGFYPGEGELGALAYLEVGRVRMGKICWRRVYMYGGSSL